MYAPLLNSFYRAGLWVLLVLLLLFLIFFIFNFYYNDLRERVKLIFLENQKSEIPSWGFRISLEKRFPLGSLSVFFFLAEEVVLKEFF